MKIIQKIFQKVSYGSVKIYYKFKKDYGLNDTIRKKRVIISMTTYPDRFSSVVYSIRCMLLQTFRPDEIIVWLDDNVSLDQLTPEMNDLKQYGVKYIPIAGDLKPHKKYIHAMQKYPEDIIITVDDDILYPPTLIKSLMDAHKKYPNVVCARRVHKVTFDQYGKLLPYNDWISEACDIKKPSHLILATGVGGVLYPPHCLDARAFDMEKISRLCLCADDIWLKCMELLHNTKVLWVPCIAIHPEMIKKSQTSCLLSDNVGQRQNDIYLKKVMDAYGLKPENFKDMIA